MWTYRPNWLLFSSFSCLLSILFFSLPGRGQDLVYRSVELGAEYRHLQIQQTYTTRDGQVWLATQKGLYRYDGAELYAYPPADSLFAQAAVTALYQDKRGQLWVGYKGGGLFYLNHNHLQAPPFATDSLEADISSFAEDQSGNLWMGTFGGGLFLLKNGQLSGFSIAQGLPDDYVYSLLADSSGRIWAGTDRGIAICSLKDAQLQVKRIGMAQGLPDNIVRVLTAGHQGAIWAGTYSGGFCRLNAATATIEFIVRKWTGGSISSLLARHHQLWIGTDQSGILLYEKGTDSSYQQIAAAMPSRRITSLGEDLQANLWAVAGRELLVVDPAFSSYALPAGLGNIHALYPVKQGVWLATEKALHFYDLASHTLVRHLSLPAAYPISTLYPDREGNIWYGTLGGGLYRYLPNTGQLLHITEAEGLPNNNILSMTASPEGMVWLTTLGGIASFKPGLNPQFVDYQSPYPKTNYVYDVLPEGAGAIWFATDGEGITYFNGREGRIISQLDSLSGRVVYSIRAAAGTLGFLSAQAGILLKQQDRWSSVNLSSGLRSLDISGFALSSKEHLLAVHPEGIDVQDLQTGQWRYYDSDWGMEALDLYHNAVRADGLGNIWIGSAQRLMQFHPEQLGRLTAPISLLTKVELFYEPVAAGRQGFDHDENHFSFHYAGLSYHQPERISYELKLEGYDTKWLQSRDGTATYSNLPPGVYTFRVRASINHNFAAAPEAQYHFRISRPFWQQLWFILLAAVLLVAVVVLVIKLREKQLRSAEQLKQDAVRYQLQTLRSQINPHFLFNSFNTLITEIEDQGAGAVTYAERLSDFFRSILTYQDKNLISLQEELQLVKNYLYLQQKRYGENLQVEIEVATEALESFIPPLTLQLLVENAIKHNVVASSKPLHIRIFTRGDELLVENRLQKKRTQEVSTGLGLNNIAGRYQLLTRRPITIEEKNQTFAVTLPLLKNA